METIIKSTTIEKGNTTYHLEVKKSYAHSITQRYVVEFSQYRIVEDKDTTEGVLQSYIFDNLTEAVTFYDLYLKGHLLTTSF